MKSFIRLVLGRASSDSPWDSRKPVREELFSVERLEQHARSLAIAQTVTPRPTKGHPLSGRLADNSTVLLHAYLPAATERVLTALDQPRTDYAAAAYGAGEGGSGLGELEPLFPKR